MVDRPTIRSAGAADAPAIWHLLEPVIRAGETYALPRDMSRDDALRYWMDPAHQVYLACYGDIVAGTYYLRANARGGGAHVANCGYVTGPEFSGRGLARTMCVHSQDRAREAGFRAMQFNLVVSTNERAVALWKALGFGVAGTLPGAFHHPAKGFVDAFVMYREL